MLSLPRQGSAFNCHRWPGPLRVTNGARPQSGWISAGPKEDIKSCGFKAPISRGPPH